MAVPATTVCIDCGGPCYRVPLEEPEFGWQAGDIVTYRCRDCADMWYLEVDPADITGSAGGTSA